MTLRKIIPALCVISLLGGCASMGSDKNTDIAALIETALEKRCTAEEKISTISLSLTADLDANRRANAIRTLDQPQLGTPIGFKVIQLKDDSLLLSADLESLTQDLQGTLGKTYLDHDDYVLTPGQFKFIDFAPVDEECHYIGVIADYHDAERATWKKVIRLETKNNKQPLSIQLERQEIIIKREE